MLCMYIFIYIYISINIYICHNHMKRKFYISITVDGNLLSTSTKTNIYRLIISVTVHV